MLLINKILSLPTNVVSIRPCNGAHFLHQNQQVYFVWFKLPLGLGFTFYPILPLALSKVLLPIQAGYLIHSSGLK